ncbi:MAG: hypothetical protein GQ574_26365 [Crocinitomix sp.]|nr:hypothetical protein [Crocinitomix sp.]
MGIIEEQNIKFRNINSSGNVYKTVGPIVNNDHFSVICHISQFKNPDTIQDFIDNVTLAINGNFDEINDPDVSNNDDIAFITDSGVELWDDNVENVYLLYPLLSFKEMLVAWHDFLKTAPYNGKKFPEVKRTYEDYSQDQKGSYFSKLKNIFKKTS